MVEVVNRIYLSAYAPQIPIRATTSSGLTWQGMFVDEVASYTPIDDTPRIEAWNKVWGEIGIAHHKKVFCES